MSMLSRDKQLPPTQQMAQTLVTRCEMGEKDACMQLQNSSFGYRLQGGQQAQARLAPAGLRSSGMLMGSGRGLAEDKAKSKGFMANLTDAYKNVYAKSPSASKYKANEKAQNALGQVSNWINTQPRSQREGLRDDFVNIVNNTAKKMSSKYATGVGIQKAVNAMRDRGYEGVYYKNPGNGRHPMVEGAKKYATGGDVQMDENTLLAPPEMMMEEGTAPPQEGEEWLPLAEVLGEEKFAEVAMLAQEFPVVAELAEMAMKTSDGFVEGPGGPTEDMVPARLSDGEFIFSAAAVEEIGLENLEAMHNEARAKAGAM